MKYTNLIKLSVIASILLTYNLSAKETKNLEEVTVTAQKNEENVQNVPISMSVFNDIQLEDQSISNIEDIGKYSPNLFFFNTGQQGLLSPSIRGIAASVISYSTPVSLYVDGVPTMSSFGFADGLEDIERIEVLKGPQGTLYGKNSEAGVINVITKKPDNETKGKFHTKLGNNGKKEYGLNISGPIIEDKFYMGISYKHNEKDGFIKDTKTGEYINHKENDYGKVNLRYTPSDKLDISLIASKSKNKNGAHDWAKAGQDKNPTSSSNLKGSSTPSIETLALNIDYDLDSNTKIKSITTKRVHKDKAILDNDLSAQTIRHFYRDYKFDTLSQELRLEKKFNTTNVVAGIYLDKEKDDLFLKRITMMDPSGANSKPQKLSSQTMSLFTNIIHPINDKLTINAGIRYDKEKKDIKIDDSNISIENNWKNISPKLSLQYNINNKSMTYATVAKGYRSGGFNPYASTNDKESYDEENLTSYEIGYKAMFLENTLKVNTALYYMNIDDMQVQEMPTPGIVYIVNAASATSKGFELEVEALLNNEFTLFASGGYNKTTFDKFKDNSGDYSGNYNPYAPKYNFNLGIQYRNDKGYYARADINGYGKTYFDSANKYSQEAYELVNAKIGYEQDNYDIYLYSNNIFNKNHDATNAYFNGTTTIYKEDREVGIQLTYRF